MTRREKVLGLCVGGAVAVTALVYLVRWTVLEPFEAVKSGIRLEQQRTQILTVQLKTLQDAEQRWQALTRRTFAPASEPQVAQRRFREDLHRLVERHGLRDPKISAGSFVRYKDQSIGVPMTITASGTLNEVVGFLRDFYRREYLARIDKVRIAAEQNIIADLNNPRRESGGAGRGGRGGAAGAAGREPTIGPNGPELRLSVSAITLVLPRLAGLEHPVIEGAPEESERGRLAETDLAAYNVLFEKNLFMPYREKPAVAAAPTPTEPRPVAATPPAPPPRDPREGTEHIFLRATVALEGEPIAFVADDRQPTQKPTEYRLDQAVDDGKLMFIHPEGMVVRVQEADGVKDYFYRLGGNFRERQLLNPDEHPEVWDAYRQQPLSTGGGSEAGRADAARVSSGRDGC